MPQKQEKQLPVDWKTQIYVVGSLLGAVMGFLSAYFYAKEAVEDSEQEERPDIPPTALLGLATSVLLLVQKFADTGKKGKKKK